MAIQFSNLASTTLASGVSSTATSVSVTSASSFPTLGSGDYFYATIGAGSGSEIVKVTGISGTTFTVLRGQDDTTAVSHSSGADVALRVTAGALADLRDGGQVYTAGSGLGLADNEFTNTAPDQTVALTGAGTTSVSGTYPNFTITGAGTTYTAGSGLSLNGTEFANTAPDQTVALTGAGATSISGTYPNFTITSTDTDTVYTHPSAHSISFITGLQAALDGKVDDAQVLTNVPAGALFTDTNTTYSVGNGGLTQQNFTNADHTKLDGIATGANNYTLPAGYATETYVGTAISNLVDSSPAALDTLNELAAALGDDPNFATTVTNSIATKLPLAGGTLTGALEIQSNGDALNLRSTTNAQPVRITFSSDVPDAQIGHIEYTHSDTVSYGSGEAFHIGGTESTTTILADGKLMYGEGIYSKPATGTGAGTRKDANWDTAYGWGDHASAGYVTTNTTYSAGTGVTLTGTTFSLTDTNAKLNLSGGTLTGNLLINSANAEVNLRSGVAGTSGAVNWTFNTNGTNYASIKLPYDTRASTGLHIDSGYPITIDTSSSAGIKFVVNAANKATINSSGLTVSGTVSATGGNSTNWNTAYGWGNHASAGYTNNVGDITGVTAGTGLTGGGTSGTPTLNVIGGSGITANANDIAVDSTVLRTTGAQTKTGALTIDVNNVAAGALRIEADQTNPNQDFYFAQEIYSTLSGTTALTADREQGGIYMDINSTATGGDTSQEHRVYGAYLDVDSTGDADLVYGVYSNVTATPTTGQTTSVYGGFFYAEDNGGAGATSNIFGVQANALSDNGTSDVNAMYAGYFKSYNAADSAAIGTATAVYGEIEVTAGSADIYGTSKVFDSHYDNNSGIAQTNTTYLYYGNYAGVLPTTAYGVYIADAVPNTFLGTLRLGVGSTSAASYGFEADVNTGMYSPANHELGFLTNGTQRLRLDSTTATFAGNINLANEKKLNIGTSTGDAFNPDSAICIEDTSNSYLQIKTGTAGQCGVLLGDTADDYVGGMIYLNSTNKLVFNAANALQLTLESGAATFAGTISSGAITATSATLTSDSSLTGARLTITDDTDALRLRSTGSGGGVNINFSDQKPSPDQQGNITYFHQDGSSYGSGNAFVASSTESTMTFFADGKLMYGEGVYLKPSSGTGAGTRKDTNWDTAYGWGNHASAGYMTASQTYSTTAIC